ncbi:MAG TPA: SPASM domain-containing protein, partial [Candidatus Hydromicrobium sp.]
LEKAFGYNIFKPLRHILDIIKGAPNISPKFINCETNLLELHIFCPDGLIYACPESIGNPEFAIGKFYPDLEYYEDKVNLWKERTILNIPKCRECKFSPICGGGCSYSSFLIYKGEKTPVCERYQEVLDTFFRLRGEKILKKYMDNP